MAGLMPPDNAAERNRAARKNALHGFSHTFRTQNGNGQLSAARSSLILVKAAVGIEPTNKGFCRICGSFQSRLSACCAKTADFLILTDSSSPPPRLIITTASFDRT
jgi:hypothetical protein